MTSRPQHDDMGWRCQFINSRRPVSCAKANIEWVVRRQAHCQVAMDKPQKDQLVYRLSAYVSPVLFHGSYCPVRLHLLPEALRKNRSGKDVIYRLPSHRFYCPVGFHFLPKA